MLTKIVKRIKWFIFNLLFFKNKYGICAGGWILYNFDVKSLEYATEKVPVTYLLHKSFDYVSFKKQLANRKNLQWEFEIISDEILKNLKEEVIIHGSLFQKDMLIAEMQCTLIEANTIHK